ncbi:hypothetical protein [Streptomyces sp. H27-D2]|nr:hypothetical protein [Streptomyces sp. H27-D2]MEC4019309.1 hypothetical protein [Streptomyces sp. H27-D2]
MSDQSFLRREFQLEFVTQELRQLILDSFGFGFRSDETQEVIIGIA